MEEEKRSPATAQVPQAQVQRQDQAKTSASRTGKTGLGVAQELRPPGWTLAS